ncbi:bidirectional sugar transporter SWEET16-like isoform X1 [Camellia sinensis]|uniref:bidirectional sugar transporter SWEET16-like isoform X1 n=1 Tax=Camellia sinensis TaxID=4442 RepID=UPI0010363E3B|nr:bidirectional sugar transporter SWEET16-like isoform X1 [Camellia sinensis]
MAGLSFIIGIIGNIISILVFASPIGTFKGVVKKKSTENYKALPYITTLLSTSLWTFYGILKPGGLLILTVNGAGAVLQFIYVTLFLIYAPRDIKVKSMKLVAILDVGFLGAVIAVTMLTIHGSLKLTFVGILCAALTIGMYAAPLAVMRTVIKTTSVEYMPFFLSFFLFLNAGVWSVYALLVKDIFIGVPNAIGFILGSAQLILYLVYKNKSSSAKSKDEMEEEEEEGSAHLVKTSIEMQDLDDHDDLKSTNRNLNKGRSLPKPLVSRQYSINKIMKTFSLHPYELNSGSLHENDVENGSTKDHP